MEAQSDIAQVLEKGVCFVVLRMEGVPGNRRVDNTKVMVNDQEVDRNDFSIPTLRVMPKQWSTRFNAVHGKARKLVEGASPPVAVEHADSVPVGVSLVAANRVPSLSAGISRIQTEDLSPLVNSFISVWPDILGELQQKVPDATVWEGIRKRLPSVDDIRRIRLKFVQLPITFLTEAGRAFADEVAAGIIGGIAGEIEKEAAKLKDRLDTGGILKDASLNQLRRQFTTLREFSFLASPETLAELAKLETEVGAADHNETSSRVEATVANISSALHKLSGSFREDAGGRFGRKLRL